MPISINGTGSITGLSAGGLPDASVTADDIASNAVTTAKVNDAAITTAKVNDASITYGKLSTSATEADNVDKRVAKAWVNFNGTGTVAIREDFNVSSIGDNATGHFTINFSSALSDANYCLVVSAMRNAGSPTANDCIVGAIATYTTYGSAFRTTACEIVTKTGTSINDDALAATVAIFR